MSLTRRDFLKLGGLAAAGLTTACGGRARDWAEEAATAVLAPTAAPADAPAGAADIIWRFLNRAGYGPRPGDYEQAAALGWPALLEEQLAPETIDDTLAERLVEQLAAELPAGDGLRDADEQLVSRVLIGSTLARAVFSRRQLFEAMVEFWSDHFNIYLRKARQMPLLKLVHDREVIRPHALGTFHDLLLANATSPAMLVYLDNQRNVRQAPNENFARELLELHTLGVDAGYTQADVEAVARTFTGWGVDRRTGAFQFYPRQHDDGAKQFLGHSLPAGRDMGDGQQLLAILAAHPATARFIATKLVRRFVADEPPPSLVDLVARTFEATGGEIKALLRVIFLSDAFAAAPPKLKRPYTFFVSAVRILDVTPEELVGLGRRLSSLGQMPFLWPAPNGYPDVAPAWANNLLPRWNLALDLTGAGRRPSDRRSELRPLAERLLGEEGLTDAGAVLDRAASLIVGQPLDAADRALLLKYVGHGSLGETAVQRRLGEAIGLLLAGPGFQWV